jgi:hypothetical protein
MATQTVEEYLDSLPEDRREAISAVRQTILSNLSEGYEEGPQYRMIGYYVPHSIFPSGYHCDPKQPLNFLMLGSEKNHMAIHAMCLYGNTELLAWFQDEWKNSGKKLDMGKGCIRFKKLDDLPLDVIAKLVAKMPVPAYLEWYSGVLAQNEERKKAKKAAKG